MKEIAYIPLTPLGDVICCFNQLEHLKKFYTPCRITVFAIPLIAELMKNSVWVDEVITLKGGVHGDLDLTDFHAPDTEFDAVFNIAYHPVYLELQSMLKCKLRYGSECSLITKEMCNTHFDKWVSQEYWDNVTLKKYRTVCEQMAEPIRLADPDFNFVYPTLTPETYHIEPCPQELPEKFVLFLPGTSWLGKYWPISKYLAVAKILKAAGVEAVFAIGPQDRRLIPDLEKSGYLVLDTLPFAQLGYVINKAELIIGNDSGPMHFAAAFHRKTLHIIASGSAFNWDPYEEPIHSLIMPLCACEEKCKVCQKTCIGLVSVEKVVCKLFEKLNLPLLGDHQLHNAAVVLSAATELQKKGWNVTDDDIRAGIAAVQWPGRFELLRRKPLFIVDGGHNPQCIEALVKNIDDYLQGRELTVLTGVLADKDFNCMYGDVARYAREFVTITPASPRAMQAADLAAYLSRFGKPATAYDSVKEGVNAAIALAGETGVVLCYGSLYMLGDIKAAVDELLPE